MTRLFRRVLVPYDFSDAAKAALSFADDLAAREHGTVTVLTGTAPPRPVEVTTFRGEGEYLDGRRPSSVTIGTSSVATT